MDDGPVELADHVFDFVFDGGNFGELVSIGSDAVDQHPVFQLQGRCRAARGAQLNGLSSLGRWHECGIRFFSPFKQFEVGLV